MLACAVYCKVEQVQQIADGDAYTSRILLVDKGVASAAPFLSTLQFTDNVLGKYGNIFSFFLLTICKIYSIIIMY